MHARLCTEEMMDRKRVGCIEDLRDANAPIEDRRLNAHPARKEEGGARARIAASEDDFPYLIGAKIEGNDLKDMSHLIDADTLEHWQLHQQVIHGSHLEKVFVGHNIQNHIVDLKHCIATDACQIVDTLVDIVLDNTIGRCDMDILHSHHCTLESGTYCRRKLEHA